MKKLDFWQITVHAIQNKVSIYKVLEAAKNKELLILDNEKILLSFINYFKNLKKQHYAQIFQDVFASFVVQNNFEKTFLEFGATDGISLSNTFLLEKELGWSGMLAEPDIKWFKSLKKNRPESKIITKCIWKKSDEKLNFFSSSQGALSTLEEFKYSDFESMPANSKDRNKSGKNIPVETISLNDVINEYFNGLSPSYISVDTEGSEFEILKAFNFSKFRPCVFTVEHNFTKFESMIDELMSKNNYIRIFNKLTSFDAWYVSEEALEKLK